MLSAQGQILNRSHEIRYAQDFVPRLNKEKERFNWVKNSLGKQRRPGETKEKPCFTG